MELFNEQGQRVEALTPEEVEAKLNETRMAAIEEGKSLKQEEVDNLNFSIGEKNKELEQAKKELEVEKSKDKNLSGQRKIIEDREKKIESLEKEIGDYKTSTEKRLVDIETKEKGKIIRNMINDLAGGDKNVADKIKFFYDNFKGDPVDEKEIQERIKNAYTLAVGARPGIPLTGPIVSSAGGTPIINPSGEKLNPELKDLAGRMGIDDKTLKRHNLI